MFEAIETTNSVLVAAQPAQFSVIEALVKNPVSYTHLRAHETVLDIVCRLLLEKKKKASIKIRRTENKLSRKNQVVLHRLK